MIKVSVASPQELVPVDRGRMRQVARAVLEAEGVADAEISLAFVDNPTIHRLNLQYLRHDEPTDVLSFPLSEANARRGGPAQTKSNRRYGGPGLLSPTPSSGLSVRVFGELVRRAERGRLLLLQ